MLLYGRIVKPKATAKGFIGINRNKGQLICVNDDKWALWREILWNALFARFLTKFSVLCAMPDINPQWLVKYTPR
jgi:hypothetical protein